MTIHLGWPQIIVALIMIAELIYHTINHGKPRELPYNAWGMLWSLVVYNVLFYLGGWFGK